MSYDNYQLVPAGTYAAFGTNAAAADVIRIKVPKPITVNELLVSKGAGTDATTGGYTVSKSLAGTGADAAFGTALITGTSAAASYITGTVTATAFAAGDVLVVTRTAGTSASLTSANVGFWYGL